MASLAWANFNPLPIVQAFQKGDQWAWDDANNQKKYDAQETLNNRNALLYQRELAAQPNLIADQANKSLIAEQMAEQVRIEKIAKGVSGYDENGNLITVADQQSLIAKRLNEAGFGNAAAKYERDGITAGRNDALIAGNAPAALAYSMALNPPGFANSAVLDPGKVRINGRDMTDQEALTLMRIGAGGVRDEAYKTNTALTQTLAPYAMGKGEKTATAADDGSNRQFADLYQLEIKNGKTPQEAAASAQLGVNAYRQNMGIVGTGGAVPNASAAVMGGAATARPTVATTTPVAATTAPAASPIAAALNSFVQTVAPPAASPIATALNPASAPSPVVSDDPYAAKSQAIQTKELEAAPLRSSLTALQNDLSKATSLDGRRYVTADTVKNIQSQIASTQSALSQKDAEIASIYRTSYNKPASAMPQGMSDLNNKYK